MKPAKLSLITALALATLVSLAPPVRAQDTSADSSKETTKTEKSTNRPRTRRQSGSQIDRLATQLKLTDEQKSKLQPILQDQRKKLGDLRQNSTLSSKDRRAKVREVREQTNEKVQAFLSKEQSDQFKELREQAMTRGARSAASGSQTDRSSGSATEKK